MVEALDRIYGSVEKRINWGVSCLSRLVQFDSVSGNEKNAQHYIADIFRELNCSVDMWEPEMEELKSFPDFLTRRESFTDSPNVAGVLLGTGGGRSLILNGHIDVVPAEKIGWHHSPWSGTVSDGFVYGRGTSDMKGGTVSFLIALMALKDAGIRLKGDVIIESVIEEESGSAGTLACVKRGYKADAAIIPEPTDLKLFTSSMGSSWFRVKVSGKSAHGATSYQGVNAIEKAYIILNSLKSFEAKRNKKEKHELFRFTDKPFAVNIGKLNSGDWPSTVPGSAVFEGRMGISPKETVADALRDFEEDVRNAAETDPWLCENIPEVEWFGSCWTSGEISPDEPIVKTVSAAMENNCGIKTEPEGAPWATDAPALIRYGNTPTVVFGPGFGDSAHQINEKISIENMRKAAMVFAETLVSWCGMAGS